MIQRIIQTPRTGRPRSIGLSKLDRRALVQTQADGEMGSSAMFSDRELGLKLRVPRSTVPSSSHCTRRACPS
jgi:hypothetical protein